MQNQAFIPDDTTIIDLYWARDEQAIEYTDLKYRTYLLSVIKGILSDLRDREECLNDTYVGAWNSMPPHRPQVLPAFLCAIMRRKAIDVYRSHHTQKSVPQSLSVSFDDLSDYAVTDALDETEERARALGKVIDAYLATLDDRKRYIFISRYFYARPIEQIATMLSVSRGTVNREISQIKQTLREYLAKEGYSI